MTFLELLTGEPPFSEMDHFTQPWRAHNTSALPKRPTDPSAVKAGLNDEMWSLLNRCWTEPTSRPSIEEVQEALAYTLKDNMYSAPTYDVDHQPPWPEHTNVRNSPQDDNSTEQPKANSKVSYTMPSEFAENALHST
jgi:hypothetical protein